MDWQISPSYQSLVFHINMLPNELQEKILYHLPTDDATRYKVVCKEWQMAIESWALRTPMAYTPQPKTPFFFMYNFDGTNLGTYAYNIDKRRWVSFKIPTFNQEQPVPSLDLLPPTRTYFNATTSWGLVCLLDHKHPNNIYVCNLVLKNPIRLLPKAPNSLSDLDSLNCAITLSTDIHSRKYVVALVRSHQRDYNKLRYKITIQLYESRMRNWIDLHSEDSDWWICNCVIHKDTLYSVATVSKLVGATRPYHGVVAYNLSKRSQKQFLSKTMVLVPCVFTEVKLMSLNDKLILVGVIMNQDPRSKTIGIWEMRGNEWKEISRTPSDLLRCFQERSISTESISGCGNIVFLQSSISGALLIYELCTGIWEFVPKPPAASRNFRFDIFRGFCFEPRLDITPL